LQACFGRRGGGPWDLCSTSVFYLQFLIQSLPKPGRPNRLNVATSRGDDAVHHLDATGKISSSTIQFFHFIQILLNRVLHDFLQQGYTPYGVPQPPPFPQPTTPDDPSTPHVDNTQVNETIVLYSSQNLDY
jgi:hypothetical protein